MSNYVFNNQVSAGYVNANIPPNNSWIQVDNNAGRPLYAQASYITNLDGLVISLTSGNVNIGDVHITDPYTGLHADIAQIGPGLGALRVLSQDLTATSDSISIGDQLGHYALITNSALNVFTTNNVSSVSVTNFPIQLTAISITNPVSNFDIVACNVTLPVSGNISVSNSVTAVQILNPVTSLSAYIINPQIEITNDVGNPIPISTSQVIPVSGNLTIGNTVSAVIIPNSNATPVLVKQADTLQIDPLGRLRTALNSNQWWYQAAVDKDGDLRYAEQFTALSAQSLFIPAIGSVTMTSGLSSTGSAIRQTRRYFKYRPGVGHQVFFTMNWSDRQAGVVKRMGQFDSSDGLFFELSGTNFNVVVRRSLPDGTIIEDRTNSANFSNDKLDGTGPSTINMFTAPVTANSISAVSITPVTQANYNTVWNVVFDTNGVDLTNTYKVGTKITLSGASNNLYNGIVFVAGTSTTQLTGTYVFNPASLPTGRTISFSQSPWNMEWTYWVDYIGGRTSRVRWVIASPNYGAILLHTYSSGGTLGTQFINEPASPLRYEIFNTTTQTVLPILTLASEAVDVEAEVSLNPSFAGAITQTDVTWPSTASTAEYAILGAGLRQGQPYNRSDLQLQDINIFDLNPVNSGKNSSPAIYSWRLMLNPAISGTIPTPVNFGKSARFWDYGTGVQYVSGGVQVLAGYGSSSNVIDARTSLNFLNIGTNVDMTNPDQLVLFVTQRAAGSGALTAHASLNVIEAL
jgi:hypothetical protein